MIDTRIVLVTVDVGSVSIREVKTLDAACEPNERGIQTIRGRFARRGVGKLVGRWHAPQCFLHIGAVTDC